MAKDFYNETDNEFLISSLRQEVGEIIQTWVIYKEIKIKTQNEENKIILEKLFIIKTALKNDIISKISELSEKKKFNQINFDLVIKKLSVLKNEFQDFEKFVIDNHFRDNRNNFISHKYNFQNVDNMKGNYRISDFQLLKAISKSLILIKRIDTHFYGENIKKQWFLMRKKRYILDIEPSVAYILLPYINK